ncbi:hypothetical protein BT69DRAFT_1275370 [Atractiella rhizophila]|nr:hypothetical protein BT69DRAFT_1275370 [Atractiella rhizophila]
MDLSMELHQEVKGGGGNGGRRVEEKDDAASAGHGHVMMCFREFLMSITHFLFARRRVHGPV